MTPKFVARHPMTASRELAGEMIVISAGDSRLFTLNEVGAAIWKAADGVTPLQDIVATSVCADHDVSLDVALADVETFVDELVAQGVMISSGEPIDVRKADRP